MLLQLTSLPQIPRAHCVVQATGPQAIAIWADVNARGTVCMTLELTHQCLIVQIPDGDVAIAAAREAHLRIGADGQCIAGGGSWCEFGFNAWCRTGQVPNWEIRCFTTNDQGAAVRQQFHWSDVVVTLLYIRQRIEPKKNNVWKINIWLSLLRTICH